MAERFIDNVGLVNVQYYLQYEILYCMMHHVLKFGSYMTWRNTKVCTLASATCLGTVTLIIYALALWTVLANHSHAHVTSIT